MRQFYVMLAVVSALAVTAGGACAAEVGTVRGTIVLERGRLAEPLERDVLVTATDLAGNPVGHVTYRAVSGALRYAIADLPLGDTLLVELTLRQRSGPGGGLSGSGAAVPLLARSDHSSPIYAFVLSRARPERAPLDFRVAVMRDPTPQAVSMRSGSTVTR